MAFNRYDGHVNNQSFLKIAPFQSENKDIMDHYHTYMFSLRIMQIYLKQIAIFVFFFVQCIWSKCPKKHLFILGP